MSTNIPSDVYLHKVIYRALSNISKSRKEKEEKVKIVRIITKLIENIVNAEKNQEDSEKFRKIRVKNPNISLMFEIDGNYEFIKSIGFEEKTIDGNEFLYLPKSNVNIPLLEKLMSYVELLVLNFQSENKDEENYYEKNSLKRSVYTEDYFQKPDENVLNNNNNNEENNKADNEENEDSINLDEDNDIFENIEESPETKIIKKNKNTEINPPSRFSKQAEQQGKDIPDNPIKTNDDNNNNNAQPNIIFGDASKNKKKNKKIKYKLKVAPNSDLLNNQNSIPDSKANTKYCPFNRIAIDCIKSTEKKIDLSSSIKKLKTNCKDDIGKECLVLTNIFREENYLPELEWNDELWKIAYTHSKNMGEKKVRYGHSGFHDRINQCPFTLTKSCENVFMCYDSCNEIEVAKMAVDGWINSPNSRNLLSDTTVCAIASYKNKSGTVYLTQLFGKI